MKNLCEPRCISVSVSRKICNKPKIMLANAVQKMKHTFYAYYAFSVSVTVFK